MPKRPHTELTFSKDGPWISFHAGGSKLTYNLRHIAADLSAAAGNGPQRRTLQAWLRERKAEGKEEQVKPPEPRKPIPASRLIPRRTVKS